MSSNDTGILMRLAACPERAPPERVFRSLKSVGLKARPVFHRAAERVRAHVLLGMLAYYTQWRMRKRLATLLFDDEAPASAELFDLLARPAELKRQAFRLLNVRLQSWKLGLAAC